MKLRSSRSDISSPQTPGSRPRPLHQPNWLFGALNESTLNINYSTWTYFKSRAFLIGTNFVIEQWKIAVVDLLVTLIDQSEMFAIWSYPASVVLMLLLHIRPPSQCCLLERLTEVNWMKAEGCHWRDPTKCFACFICIMSGRLHSTEVAYALLTHQSRVRISTLQFRNLQVWCSDD